MTDLARVLPRFDVGRFANLIPALDKHGVTTSELLTLEAAEIGKRTQLPLLDLKRLCKAVVDALHADLGIADSASAPAPADPLEEPQREDSAEALNHTPATLGARWRTISTLDAALDAALGGGIPTGYITEITGESGAGKTQFLLSLLLAVQLPPPHGLGRPAIYISTEAPLSTRRLSQMLAAGPLFEAMTRPERQALLDRIFSIATPDLESQEHILTNQVPVMVERFDVGLLVLDSVAANYRAEFERGAHQLGSNMGARSAELVRLGMELRELARKHNLAIVVANQVADRFGGARNTPGAFRPGRGGLLPSSLHPKSSGATEESPLATRSRGPVPTQLAVEPSSSMAELVPRSSISNQDDEPPRGSRLPPPLPPPPPEDEPILAPPALLLDHQQRWFTGWGDDPYSDLALKTPSLGLVWTTQIASRIALFKRPAWGVSRYREDDEERPGVPTMKNWRRWMKVVFAPHAPASGPGISGAVEFEVTMGGLKAVTNGEKDEAEEA